MNSGLTAGTQSCTLNSVVLVWTGGHTARIQTVIGGNTDHAPNSLCNPDPGGAVLRQLTGSTNSDRHLQYHGEPHGNKPRNWRLCRVNTMYILVGPAGYALEQSRHLRHGP